jgi:multidrug efflux system outer membrane protein
MRALVICAAALLVAGCAGSTPPPPAMTAVSPPVQWRASLGPVNPLEQQWWTAFGDPVLTALVETALANNDDIAIAAARVRQARAQEDLVRAQTFPALTFGAAGGPARALGPFGAALTQTATQPLFQASYELDLFGRIDHEVFAAEQDSVAAAAARDTVKLSVASATARGYLTLRGLDARAWILRETLAARQAAFRNMQDQVRTGYTSRLELNQSESEVQAAAQLLPQVELAISLQENALSVLVGLTPGSVERGVTITELTPPPLPDGLPSSLLRRRPDLVRDEAALASTDAGLAAARLRFLPAVRLTGAAGAAFSSALSNPLGLWSIGGSVLAPLFDGGRLTAGVDHAAARRDEAAFAYRRTALNAFREVEDNRAAVQQLTDQRAALELQHVAVQEALRHATNRYRAGYTSYLEQLDAQRSLLAVELNLAQVRTDQLTTSVALYQAMGGGWSE